MNKGQVILRREGAIARILLDNAARLNAISIAMWDRFDQILDEVGQDPGIRVVVIAGAGGRAFSAGADISEFDRRHADPEAVRYHSERDAVVTNKLETLAKPTIAEIEGYCFGGAVALALSGDLRICAEDASFAIPPPKLGHCYEPHSIARVMRAVGLANTREILFTARAFSAAEALQMGLVNRVVAKHELSAYVRGYAETIAGNAPLTVDAVKRITAELAKDPEERDMGLCEDLVARCFASEDHREGQRAFNEKRKPVFTGR
jgi:enoyl-CoA hydratase